MKKFRLDKNRKYWEDPNTRSLIDANFKQLEIGFITKYLKKDYIVGDIGCGDGVTAISIAPKVKKVIGIERSTYLKQQAKKNLLNSNLNNIIIKDGDILKLNLEEEFNLVITERVIINLPSWDYQLAAIDNLFKSLKPGGLYIMIENTNDGLLALNQLREMVGLKPVGIHWHNVYLDYEQFSNSIKGKFEMIERKSFSLYYFLTRVYTQMFANFEGFGIQAKKDEIFSVSDKAAKEIEDKMAKFFTFTENENILGPIQGFALKKI